MQKYYLWSALEVLRHIHVYFTKLRALSVYKTIMQVYGAEKKRFPIKYEQ